MAQSSDTLQDFVIKAKNLQKKNKAKAKDPKPKNSQRPLLFVLGVPQGWGQVLENTTLMQTQSAAVITA